MEAMQNLTPEQRQLAIRGMVEGLEQRLQQNPQDRAGWLRLANAWRVLGENAKAGEAFARADALGALDAGMLADWAESLVRLIPPGEPPKAATIKVLERLERAEPRNGLALFYLGAAYAAAGDKQEALKRWRTLLAMLPADAPVRGVLERRIKELE
jgi:cytochrome c-type biogenesis protein CcmH